jgi:2-polyprenyl-3-methyl-5-hydroxy-6-metoxy-1,4-benzoquinol methylase
MASPLRCNVCEASVDPEHDAVWTKDGLEILRCPSCGLLFRADLPSPEELPELYDRTYFRADDRSRGGQGYADYVGEADLHRLNAQRRLSLLEGFIPHGGLLDVGCAAGFFLDEGRRRGWQVTGVELSAEMAEWASGTLGLDPVIQGSFTGHPWDEGTFDCVTMWDYIEHTIDPLSELQLARRLLRPGGVLALSTGDAGSLVARLTGRRWHLLTPRHHNYFFTRSSLLHALERAGFSVLAVRHLGARYSVRYLAHKLRTLADLRPLRGLERRLGGSRVGTVALPVNLGDIVTVVARSGGSS